MNAVEFTAELTPSPTLAIPTDVAARLPTSGRVRVLVLTEDDLDRRDVALNTVIHDDVAEDAAYARGYERVPEDMSLTTAMLPHLAVDAGDWE